MATYNLKCTECDEKFEVVQSMKAELPTDCVDCVEKGIKGTLKQIISSAGGGFRIYGKGVHKPTSRMT